MHFQPQYNHNPTPVVLSWKNIVKPTTPNTTGENANTTGEIKKYIRRNSRYIRRRTSCENMRRSCENMRRSCEKKLRERAEKLQEFSFYTCAQISSLSLKMLH